MVEDEEKLQLRADLERCRKMVRQKDEIIEEMEHDLNRRGKEYIFDKKLEAREKELNAQIRQLQVEVDGKDATIQEQRDLVEDLRRDICTLEKNSRELLNRTSSPKSDESTSFEKSEKIRISEECEAFKEVASTLYEQNAELKKNAVELKEELESAMEHIRSLQSHIKTLEEESSRLEGELFDLKNSNNGKIASSGNSIFAEAMEAERKLEEDLKVLFREKQSLACRVKRLTMEKEEAEERARSFISRGLIIRNAINHIDVEEMRRLRTRAHELETERIHLWEKLFTKMKTTSKREMGAIIAGYFESFKCSIESVKGGFDDLMKKNENYVNMIRVQQKEILDLKEKIEQQKFDIECYERKMHSVANANLENVQLLEPLKAIDNARPSFFVKPKKVESINQLETSMSNTLITPQEQSENIEMRSAKKKEVLSEWAEKRMKAKAEKNSATPGPRYNYITLTGPTPKFKSAILQMPSTPSEPKND